MINVLIVDDEKIVRKGLVSFMPWQQFGMTVIGEANNGENALKFIETNKVDLLFTDLAMPVMSGIELMREVNSRYPHIQIVVLTLHQDFDYIQEALRLGAIDYIAKTDLEKEQFEDLLGRIVSLLDKKKVKNEQDHQQKYGQVEQIFVVYTLNQQHHDDLNYDKFQLNGAIEVETGVWYWTYRPLDLVMSDPNYAFYCFQDLSELDRKSILQLIRMYRKHRLFYDFVPSNSFQYKSKDELMNITKYDEAYDLNEIKQNWLSSNWIYEDFVFENMLQELKDIQLPSIRMTRLFFSLTDEWNRMYSKLLANSIVMEDSFAYYSKFVEWLIETRDTIREANTKPQFSIEIQSSIAMATSMAQQTFNEPLTASEMAKSVNMSLSYFSQCFKQIVGKTYTDYLRDVRMDRAKMYLLNTSKTIQWIAEEVGYNDEKYFSRLFKEHIGILPSEFRQGGNQDRSK